jgi:hypothetical protein
MSYTDTPDGDGKCVDARVGYAEQILAEIRELQSLAEALHARTYEISGTCQETAVAGNDVKQNEPQNFCEHSLKDLSRVRRVLIETLDHLSRM